MQQVMTFQIGNEFYGIDIAKVSEIVEFTQLTPLPKAPVWVNGILNHHGRIATVLNLSTFFDFTPPRENNLRRIAVIDSSSMDIGILLEGHLEVVSEWEIKTEISADPEFLKSKYVANVLVSKGRVVNLLDTDRLIADLDGYFT